ncbi:MAG: hypothetical protein KDH96_02605 [Candidatus Riesia sp.]|nr:hypothetical protein [Candidatus Riesia sp.]
MIYINIDEFKKYLESTNQLWFKREDLFKWADSKIPQGPGYNEGVLQNNGSN